jgi:hypothetical protein
MAKRQKVGPARSRPRKSSIPENGAGSTRPQMKRVLVNKATEPLGGQPAAGSRPSVPDLRYQVQ